MPDLFHERHWRAAGYPCIAGIDEAGRGPLAGPVTVAAVVLPEEYEHPLLDDSKRLGEKRRENLYAEITSDPRIFWASVQIEAEEIDRTNILRATHLGMAQVFEKLIPRPDLALIDGRPVKAFPGEHRALVKGDSLSLSIAAASVIAKVERDRLMLECADLYPGYGFEQHKGYGTAAHLEALNRLGPCPIHRRSFAPVAQLKLDLR
ncbi:MAG: ribonuclease HII [Verrucomicrobiia bacterium Tous-C2TDCM]|nr:MAG: ribonuclease HII [Verrucomicrobiae bacterium Tous-C2TDCM]